MKLKQLIFLLCLIAFSALSFSQVKVRGYYRKDGTYVRPHTRSYPGSSKRSGSNYSLTNHSYSSFNNLSSSSSYDDTPQNASTRKYYFYEYRNQYYHIKRMLSVRKKRRDRKMMASSYTISNTNGDTIGWLTRTSDNVYIIYDSKASLAGRVEFTRAHNQYSIYTPTGTKVLSENRGGGKGIVFAVLAGVVAGVVLGGL